MHSLSPPVGKQGFDQRAYCGIPVGKMLTLRVSEKFAAHFVYLRRHLRQLFRECGAFFFRHFVGGVDAVEFLHHEPIGRQKLVRKIRKIHFGHGDVGASAHNVVPICFGTHHIFFVGEHLVRVGRRDFEGVFLSSRFDREHGVELSRPQRLDFLRLPYAGFEAYCIDRCEVDIGFAPAFHKSPFCSSHADAHKL